MASIAPEIKTFIDAVGAKELTSNDDLYSRFKQVFRRRNYFFFRGNFIIVKISRRIPLWWGVKKEIIDILNQFPNYYLVLLTTERDGYVFSKNEIKSKINSGAWKLAPSDNNYKIGAAGVNDINAFSSHDKFFEKVGLQTGVQPT